MNQFIDGGINVPRAEELVPDLRAILVYCVEECCLSFMNGLAFKGSLNALANSVVTL